MISQEVIAKAVCIADEAVRSDIECYAVQQQVEVAGAPCWIYSTTQAQPLRDSLTEEQRRTAALACPEARHHIDGKEIVKVVVPPGGKLVSIVVKG